MPETYEAREAIDKETVERVRSVCRKLQVWVFY